MIGFWEWVGEAWRHWRHGPDGWQWLRLSPMDLPGGYHVFGCSRCTHIQVR